MGRIILVASGKGGTGKTVFATNFAAILAERGKRVVMLDMDLGLRNLDLYLGLENKVIYNVLDVLSGVCKIKKALVRDKRFPCLYMLAASPSRDIRDITPLHMEVLCEKLLEHYDYIIIDAPAGTSENFALAATSADTAVIITEAEYSSLRDADIVDRYLQDIGIKNRCFVANKIKAELLGMEDIPGIDDMSRILRIPIKGIVQYDDNFKIATNRGVPIVLKKGTYIEKNFSNIVSRVLEEE